MANADLYDHDVLRIHSMIDDHGAAATYLRENYVPISRVKAAIEKIAARGGVAAAFEVGVLEELLEANDD